MLIPTDCIEICDSKNSHLPLFEERKELQKFFVGKSEEFGKNNANSSADGEKFDLKNIHEKDASDAFSTFLWSQKINCSAMQSFVGGSIGTVLLGISV